MSEIEKAIESINFFKNTDFGGLLKARELLEELQESEKRQAECKYCHTGEYPHIKFCPECGRDLRGENDG